MEYFFRHAITISRSARTASTISKGDTEQGTPAEIWSGNAAINEVDPQDAVFQDRHGVQSTHRVKMPIPDTTVWTSCPPIAEDLITCDSRTLRILQVRKPMKMEAVDTICAHLALEAKEVKA